jgi:dTDP-glucose 4,6-dehydratase
MRSMRRSILVTGGLGFIGSAFIRHMASKVETIVNLDAHRYSADERRLPGSLGNVITHRIDVIDPLVKEVIGRIRPEAVVHFAAETHVTRSESAEDLFFTTNVEGTRNVLDAAVAAGVEMAIHVSTDEVYGPAADHPFHENEKLPGEGRATSPYARSKAVADDLARSYGEHLRVVVVRPTNCFGPWQHPEKAIPRWIIRGLCRRRLPVWGDGGHVRDWMYVDDVCSAIEIVLDHAGSNDVYNIGPEGAPQTNLDIARAIATWTGAGDDAVYLTQYDRPDHDRRYSVDSRKIRSLGWSPSVGLDARLRETVEWYAANRPWWEGSMKEAEGLYADDAERPTA